MTDSVDVPAEVRPFVESGTLPIALERADLDGDGRQDFVLVLERQKARASDPDVEQGQRPLLVLVRRADNSLRETSRNAAGGDRATRRGTVGDPCQGGAGGLETFTGCKYGGSAWRWSVDYKFGYSRKDQAWQLVRVDETSFHASAPEEGTSRSYSPPGDFGKIDLKDFDPEKWKGQGQK